MLITISHLLRLAIDLLLVGLMLELEIYEFTLTVQLLIFFRLSVGHGGRICQYRIGLTNHIYGLLAGFVANVIKTVLETAILLNLYEKIPNDIAGLAILGILGRNIFEAVSLCEEFSD